MVTISGLSRMEWLLIGLPWAVSLGWLARAVESWIGLRRIPDLTRLPEPVPPDAPGDGPLLSVVVPACNEEAAIEATIHSLLGSRGVPLQVIAVDDRSTDRTGAILDRLAREYAAPGSPGNTLEVLHIETLPAGWMGKPHALAAGAARSRASYLLFTDADILFRDDAILRSFDFLQRENLDHLALTATPVTHTAGERVVLAALPIIANLSLRLWKVNEPGARESLGVGSFTMVRREAYEQVGGWAAVRLEVLEDLRFGWEIKRRHGLRQAAAFGKGLLLLHWAPGALGLANNLGKNGFAVFQYRLALALPTLAGLLVLLYAPIAALAGPPAARWSFVPFAIALVLLHRRNMAQSGIPMRYLLLFPVGSALLVYGMARSAVLTLARGGVEWRGTRYPLALLRKHAGPLR